MCGPPPLVSVVMPVHDGAAMLPYAIESVLSQTLESWELVLVDDASTDHTLDVMRAYARLDERLTVVRNDLNSRMGPEPWEPRNDGLALARGRLIAYLDGDNAWRPRFLERLATRLLGDDRLQLVFCDSRNHYSVEEAREAAAVDPRPLTRSGPGWTVFSAGPLDPARLGAEQYVDTNEIMHRATVFDRIGGRWRTLHPRRDEVNARQGRRSPHRRHNDLDLVERIVEACGVASVAHVPEELVDYHYASSGRPAHPEASRLAAGGLDRTG